MNKFMKVAADLSNDNFKYSYGGPFGACIVKDEKIISKGINRVIKDNDPTAHAEIIAIRNACKKLKTHDLINCELYTSCFPCPMCLSAIIWSNIKMVYYANTKEDASNIGFRDDFIYDYIKKLSHNIMDKDTLDMKMLDREKAIIVFEKYKNKEDKITY